ncbi:hypothetical protein PSENEW3n2_00001710 [Picochlorum sp. SENEW3]|nr:hypothetical protein PSENEW3n2_00001710 [Picochlorum sp. SENEW3]WPT14480.1 hypothetical protein PSENEW3_00001710 [Picochlorum sp. SENEW3]WPT18332.1 hypothetical protein PSENEW3_00006333 [Picochlorum sp. SENEW3]
MKIPSLVPDLRPCFNSGGNCWLSQFPDPLLVLGLWRALSQLPLVFVYGRGGGEGPVSMFLTVSIS